MGAMKTYGQTADPAERLRKKQGAELRKIRKFRDLTMVEVARRMTENGVQVTQQAISQWECGTATPRPHYRVAICRVLDVPPSMIWNLDGEAA